MPDWTMVTVRARFIYMDGSALTSGRLSLWPRLDENTLTSPDDDLIISGQHWTATPDPTGLVTVTVPAGDSPGITPSGWTYYVHEPTGRRYSIEVSHNTPVLNDPDDPLDGHRVLELADAAPVSSSPGTGTPVRGVGIESVEVVDGNLIVTYTDGAVQNAGSVVAGVSQEQLAAALVPYATTASLGAHVSSPTPHPAYDGMPSLRLMFENNLI